MGNFLQTAAIVLVIFWAIGFFVYSIGAIIHILLVVAVITFLFRMFSGKQRVNNRNQ